MQTFESDCTFAVGYDNINIAEATRMRIPIGNTPDVLSETTADVAFLLVMAVARKAFHVRTSIARGEESFFRPKAHLGLELNRKTLGIFELGRIGIDVVNPEPLKPDYHLLSMEKVAVLPPTGSAAIEIRNAMARISAENIILGLEEKNLLIVLIQNYLNTPQCQILL